MIKLGWVDNMKNKGFNLITVIGFICVASIISAITVGVIMTNSYKSADGTSYTDLLQDADVKEFLDVYNQVTSSYYEDIDKKAMLDSAVNGMLNYLDDNYTMYMSPEEKESLNQKLEGSYRGIGISILNCQIDSVTEGSPAAKAGLQAGDVITRVEETDFTSCTEPTLISQMIRNSNKESVNIVVRRNEELKTFNIKLETIIIKSVNAKMIENTNIGYISISIFSSNIGEQFNNALNELKSKGMQKLIIDVRNNTGGYLDGAKDIASLILPKGKLIYTLKSKDGESKVFDETNEHLEISIVVLINEGSASSSEILTAALKDSYNATIIGTKSYGKGKVQQTFSLDDGSMAKYTTALWLRPNGECVDGVGIKPDIEAAVVTNENNEVIEDTPYNKAIELLNK